jgi:hypothetical protein
LNADGPAAGNRPGAAAELRPCPVCGRSPDVVTYDCPICNRDNICFYHRRDRRVWRAAGRKVVIPECCRECWKTGFARLRPGIVALRRLRRLELLGGVLVVLALPAVALLLADAWAGAAVLAALAAALGIVARAYFRSGPDLPEPDGDTTETQ